MKINGVDKFFFQKLLEYFEVGEADQKACELLIQDLLNLWYRSLGERAQHRDTSQDPVRLGLV